MAEQAGNQRIPVTVLGGAVFTSLRADHTELEFKQLGEDVMARISEHRAKWVLLDLSALLVLDEIGFSQIERLKQMLHLLGAQVIVVGIRPGVIAGLAQLDVNLGALRGAVSIERALEVINAAHPSHGQ